jgi:integrase
LNLLSVPEHYHPGAADLVITKEIDKNRYARELKVVEDVRASLESICPARGIIFGEHDYRGLLRLAAHQAGIDTYRAERISDYDFRHSSLTYLGSRTKSLVALMYIAGHRQPATTARYIHAPKDAADELLMSVTSNRTVKAIDGERIDLTPKEEADELLAPSDEE